MRELHNFIEARRQKTEKIIGPFSEDRIAANEMDVGPIGPEDDLSHVEQRHRGGKRPKLSLRPADTTTTESAGPFSKTSAPYASSPPLTSPSTPVLRAPSTSMVTSLLSRSFSFPRSRADDDARRKQDSEGEDKPYEQDDCRSSLDLLNPAHMNVAVPSRRRRITRGISVVRRTVGAGDCQF